VEKKGGDAGKTQKKKGLTEETDWPHVKKKIGETGRKKKKNPGERRVRKGVSKTPSGRKKEMGGVGFGCGMHV